MQRTRFPAENDDVSDSGSESSNEEEFYDDYSDSDEASSVASSTHEEDLDVPFSVRQERARDGTVLRKKGAAAAAAAAQKAAGIFKGNKAPAEKRSKSA